MKRTREFHEECAVRYIESMANIDRQIRTCANHLEELNARLIGIGAIRYDNEGGKAAYVDLKPAILDEMAAVMDEAERAVKSLMDERIESVHIFAADVNATICWLKHGKRMTWAEVARETDFSKRQCQRREAAGFDFIFAHMPPEYRQV